jgi:hypothetical protein
LQQIWNAFWQEVTALFEAALTPFQIVARLVGLNPSVAQTYLFLVEVFFAPMIIIHLYGDIVLLRRGRRTAGTVVGIDPGDESPDRPIIRFKDASGQEFTFTSTLGDTTRIIDAKVDVDYDPVKPRRAREAGRPVSSLLYLAFLTFLAGFPLGLLLFVT